MAVTSYARFGKKVIPNLQQKISYSDLITDINKGGTGKPLSAEAGKNLRKLLADEESARIQAINDLKTNELKQLRDAINKEIEDRKKALEVAKSENNEALGSLKSTLEGEIEATKGELNESITSLNNTITANKKSIDESITTVKELIKQVDEQSIQRDNAIEDRLATYESCLSAGVFFQGSVSSLEELGNLDESSVKEGYGYRVSDGTNSDIYIVICNPDGDFKPEGWSKYSFMHLMDAADVTNAVSAERQARKSEIETLTNSVDIKIKLVEDDISTLNTSLENEVNERKSAIENEKNRRVTEDEKLSKAIAKEVEDRKSAINAVNENITALSNSTDERFAIINGDEATESSIKNSLKKSKDYVNENILRPYVEGLNNELIITGNKIRVTYNIADGAMGVFQVVVYGGEEDSESILVNVASVNGREITIAEDSTNEHDGKNAVVKYFYRDGEQLDLGAGEGGAGEDGAGE